MIRVAPTEEFQAQTRWLSARASDGKVAVRCGDDGARARLLAGLTEQRRDWVVVRSRRGLDQAERAILDVATALGTDAVAEVGALLRGEPDEPTTTLGALTARLGERSLVVDGIDELRVRGPDPELGRILDRRRRAVERWLEAHGTIFLFGRGVSPVAGDERVFHVEHDVELRNGSTVSAGWGAGVEDRGLLLAAYLLGDHEVRDTNPSVDDLRARIDGLLPRSVRRLLAAVALHDRPLDRAIAEQLVDDRAIESGRRFGLVHPTPAGLVTDGGWTAWFRQTLEHEERQRAHLELGLTFVRSCEERAGGEELLEVEAHRHLVAAGEVEQAQRFVRYGVALLVDEARRLSRGGSFGAAGCLYETILAGVRQQGWPIGAELRGYATHYLHFNRARDGGETLEDTERGYREALQDCPGNALFWSRLVRAQLYLGRRAAALETLAQARARVAEDPLAQTFLVARTVRGLLRHERDGGRPERLVDALWIWGDYVPDSEMAREVEYELERRMEAGWKVSRLAVDGNLYPLVFTRDMLVKFRVAPHFWLAAVPELEASRGRASFPLTALAEAVDNIRDDVGRYLDRSTDQLDEPGRKRHRALLGGVDVTASGLDADRRSFTWLLGDIKERNGTHWLRTGGNFDVFFEIPVPLVPEASRLDRPYLARLATEGSGRPQGPVLGLEPAVGRTEQEIWADWRRRLVGE